MFLGNEKKHKAKIGRNRPSWPIHPTDCRPTVGEVNVIGDVNLQIWGQSVILTILAYFGRHFCSIATVLSLINMNKKYFDHSSKKAIQRIKCYKVTFKNKNGLMHAILLKAKF